MTIPGPQPGGMQLGAAGDLIQICPNSDHLLQQLALHSDAEGVRPAPGCHVLARGAQCGGRGTPSPVIKERDQHLILRVWPQGLDFSAPRYTNKHPWDPAAASYHLIAKTRKSRPVLREPGAWGLKTDNPPQGDNQLENALATLSVKPAHQDPVAFHHLIIFLSSARKAEGKGPEQLFLQDL